MDTKFTPEEIKRLRGIVDWANLPWKSDGDPEELGTWKISNAEGDWSCSVYDPTMTDMILELNNFPAALDEIERLQSLLAISQHVTRRWKAVLQKLIERHPDLLAWSDLQIMYDQERDA